jgi:glycogen synthase
VAPELAGRVRVAQLATRFPPGPGGVERHVAELSAQLGARGASLEVFTSELYREYPWEPLPSTVPRDEAVPFGRVRRLPAWSFPGAAHYTFFRGLDRALAGFRPDVLHAHTYGTHQVTVAARYHRRTGAPLVVTAHYHPPWSIEGGWWRHRLRGFYDSVLAGPTLRSAARLIVQTHEEERLLRTLGFELPPIATVPPGYRPLPAPAEEGAPLPWGGREPYLLFVGRLASNKGLLDLLEAFVPLARADPRAQLVLVGDDGGMAGAVDARLRSLGLDGRVRRVGHLSDEALATAYRSARALVLPSEYEAFGLVLVEAMAQGTPVVATRVGGIPEIVEDGRTGLLVPPHQPPALGEALLRIWRDDELRRRLGEAGRTIVVPRYRWESVAASVEAIYREVTGA